VNFVVWIWKGNRKYEAEHVNHLYRQLDRVCPGRFTLTCVTDDTSGFHSKIRVVETPPAARALRYLLTPEKANFPSCYPRLWMFSEEARLLGERVMLIDVDLVFTADPSPLWQRHEEFVGWRPMRTWGRETRFGGGIYLLTTGTRTDVWTSFKGAESIKLARAAGLRGSDQAWLSYCLASKEAMWPRNSGIYSVRDLTHELKRARVVKRTKPPLSLPADALIVQFNGPDKPWHIDAHSRHEWLRTHFIQPSNGSAIRQGA
jgi:hypothetical protein